MRSYDELLESYNVNGYAGMTDEEIDLIANTKAEIRAMTDSTAATVAAQREHMAQLTAQALIDLVKADAVLSQYVNIEGIESGEVC